MRKLTSLIVGLSLLLSFSTAKADEGMWLLSLLKKNAKEMRKMGLKLSPKDIYDVNRSSLKDAIVGLGREGSPFNHFCTGEIISDQGLFLTNHHCGFKSIQEHSSTEHDYLADGFWAYSKKEELTNPGMTASILVRMQDVTEQILAKLNDDMTEMERYKAISKVSKKITEEATKGTDYKAKVQSMFNGNQFFLFVYIIYKDVRLVGAPPSSMGKFGGDTDNWMWPRHTADFSMFRIYTAPDGKPASYSPDNVPLKPKHHFPISIKGPKEGDFAMVMGFPGTTDRYLTSFGLEETMNIVNKDRYDIRTLKLKILKEDMRKDPKVRIQYAAKYAQSANYWKYSNEQNKALKKLKTIDRKLEIEKEYLNWANENEQRAAKYGDALNMLKKAYAENAKYIHENSYLAEALLRGPELPLFAFRSTGLVQLLRKDGSEERREKIINRAKETGNSFYKDYNQPTDEKLMAGLFKMYAETIPAADQPSIFEVIKKEYNNDFKKFAADVYSNSIFGSHEKYNKFLENPDIEKLKNDIGVKVGNSLINKYREIMGEISKHRSDMAKGKRLFVDGLLQMNDKGLMAPDANSSIRLTYGKVKGYSPKDGVNYRYYTTLTGVMEKENPNDPEFVVPSRLKLLHENLDFGKYRNRQGQLPTCFLTNNDITGGNSGSPVINAKGQLIGTAFDGNSEAMSGDIDFEENLQRCINLDVRYTLFIIDKFAGAKNLIEEMDIVR